MGGTERPKQWIGANVSLAEYKTECLSVATIYFYLCILWMQMVAWLLFSDDATTTGSAFLWANTSKEYRGKGRGAEAAGCKGPSATRSTTHRHSLPLNIKTGKSRTREMCNLIVTHFHGHPLPNSCYSSHSCLTWVCSYLWAPKLSFTYLFLVVVILTVLEFALKSCVFLIHSWNVLDVSTGNALWHDRQDNLHPRNREMHSGP